MSDALSNRRPERGQRNQTAAAAPRLSSSRRCSRTRPRPERPRGGARGRLRTIASARNSASLVLFAGHALCGHLCSVCTGLRPRLVSRPGARPHSSLRSRRVLVVPCASGCGSAAAQLDARPALRAALQLERRDDDATDRGARGARGRARDRGCGRASTRCGRRRVAQDPLHQVSLDHRVVTSALARALAACAAFVQ